METKRYLDILKKIDETLLEFIEQNDSSSDESQISKFNFFKDLTKEEKPEILKETLLILSSIASHHHRTINFNDKINKILLFYKKDIKQSLSNKEIFNIFKENYNILIFLIKEKIITVDQTIVKLLKNKEFFSIEIDSFYGKENKNIKDDDEFERKRTNGENNSTICKIIRDDSIVDFITYVNKENLSLKSQIKPSIFETNRFLIENIPSLIEYSAFYGSIEIFNYLIQNNVEPTKKLWLYAIHGQNPEIISILERNFNDLDEEFYRSCFIESVKCHHNSIANYIEDNFLTSKYDYFQYIISHHNYVYFTQNNDYWNYKNEFIQNNYVSIVKVNLKENENIIIKQRLQTSLLAIAIKSENIEIVNFMINKLFFSVNEHYEEYIYANRTNYSIRKSMLFMAVETDNEAIFDLVFRKIDLNIYKISDYYRKDFFIEEDDEYPDADNDKFIFVSEEKTALSKAVENGNLKFVERLLSNNKIDINEKNCLSHHFYLAEDYTFDYFEEEKTPLTIAVEKGDYEMVNLLLKNPNIDVNCVVSKKDIDVSKYCEDDYDHHHRYGPDECNEEEWTIRRTALEIAEENNKSEIVALLKNAH